MIKMPKVKVTREPYTPNCGFNSVSITRRYKIILLFEKAIELWKEAAIR